MSTRISSSVLEQLEAKIRREVLRAHDHHGPTSMFDGPSHTDDSRVAVILEELGEVARVLNDQRHKERRLMNVPALLHHELIQVAAMAITWLARLEQQPPPAGGSE